MIESNYEALTSIIYHSILCQKFTACSSTIYVCFSSYLRMSPELFEHFLRLVTSIVKKEDNKFQQVIPTEEFLDGKFRVLASGNTSGLLYSVTESRNLKSYFKRNLQFNFFFVIICLPVVTAKKEWKKNVD